MPDSAALPPESPNPLRGHVPIPPAVGDAPPNKSPAPSASADSSPLGPAKQYHHAPNLPSFIHQVSVTGATKNDPAGALTRQKVVRDPDWASPLRGLWLVLNGYALSFIIFWLGYGFMLALLLGISERLLGAPSQLSGGLLGNVLLVGPYYGVAFDFYLMAVSNLAAFLGFISLALDLFLGLLFLVTHDWPGRLRYSIFMFVLVLVKVGLIVWVSSRN